MSLPILKVRGVGHKPDPRRPDDPEWQTQYGASHLPFSVKLWERHPEAVRRFPEDQHLLNACTGYSAGVAYEYAIARKTKRFAEMSHRFIYWNARVLDGQGMADDGATIRNAMRGLENGGSCLESYCPMWGPGMVSYVNNTPDRHAYQQAARHKGLGIRRVARDQVDDALHSGFPVVCGIPVYDHVFFSDVVWRTGVINLPLHFNDYRGNHAIVLFGYDHAEGRGYGPNSYGREWGSNNEVRPGWFSLDWTYIANPKYSSDFWVIGDVEGIEA